MERVLDGTAAVVTGGGRGIGAATAGLLARLGARVCVVSRTRSELDQVVAGICKEQGASAAFAFDCDVSDPEAVKRLFAKVLAEFGRIDHLVNNAAVVGKADFEDLEPDSWDHVMAVNLRGPYLCSRALFAESRKAGRGASIVNLGSLGGIRGTEKFRGLSAYVVSKSGIVGLTEALAVEGRELGIRVNCVAPGAVDTEMLRQAAPHLKTETSPEQVAEVIAYLCDAKRSGALSGTTLEIHSNL